MSTTAIPQGFKALPLSITQLSLAAVLKCGQSFRWMPFPLFPVDQAVPTLNEPTHEYRFCLEDRVVCLRQSDDFLFYRSVFDSPPSASSLAQASAIADADVKRDSETLAFIRDYFQLDTDLLALYDEWSMRDPVFRNLKGRFSGIRMLRQDPWECLISFICSSNNNISRISKMVQNLCTHFAPPLLTLDEPVYASIPGSSSTTSTVYHSFPSPSALASTTVSSKLRSLGFGYRADFIQKTASSLLETHGSDEAIYAFLEGLRREETDIARGELMKLMGVGRKVADCILLMSLDKREVIPVDTHVHQIAIKHYNMRSSSNRVKTPMTPKLYDEVALKLTKIWGEYAGWAHSILFTADLRSFSTYGLPTPSPTPTPTPSVSPMKSSRGSIPSESQSPRKKRRKQAQVELSATPSTAETGIVSLQEEVPSSGSLADRVKRRRRVAATSVVTKEW